jgi:hypothetical protein
MNVDSVRDECIWRPECFLRYRSHRSEIDMGADDMIRPSARDGEKNSRCEDVVSRGTSVRSGPPDRQPVELCTPVDFPVEANVVAKVLHAERERAAED